MKRIQLITAALLALGIAARSSAQTVPVGTPIVYLTGSSAFRSTIEAALANNSGRGPGNGGLFDAGSVQFATWKGGSFGSASYMVFYGTISNNPICVDCAWSGSEAGIASACNTTLGNFDRNGNPITLSGSPETWVQATNAGVTLAAGGILNTGSPPGGIMESGPHGADLAQADTSQAISWTPYVAGTQTALTDFGSEGAVTFTFARNVQLNPTHEWLDCTNITLPQLNTILSSGSVLAGFIDGNTNDNDMFVYLVGRNRGSGTRMNTLSTSQYGAHNTVHQYSIGYGVESTDPSQTDNTLILTNEANNGYESGGGVVDALSDTAAGTLGSCQQADPVHLGYNGWFAIGYVSPADALNTGNNGGDGVTNWMTLDGVFECNSNIENGSYWFWGHEHLYGKYQIAGTPALVGNLLFAAVTNSMALPSIHYGVNPGDHDPGIPWSLMNVHKASDIAFPTPGSAPNGL